MCQQIEFKAADVSDQTTLGFDVIVQGQAQMASHLANLDKNYTRSMDMIQEALIQGGRHDEKLIALNEKIVTIMESNNNRDNEILRLSKDMTDLKSNQKVNTFAITKTPAVITALITACVFIGGVAYTFGQSMS